MMKTKIPSRMKTRERARNAEECFERSKQRIINELQKEISRLKCDLKYRKDLDNVINSYVYDKTTGNSEIVNIVVRDYLKEQLQSLESRLADTATIEYQARHNMYNFVKELPFKDNAGYTIQRYVGYFDSKIRVPSLKRKTAWKRFYKMFPGLKGREYITGHSTGGAERESYIKLKQL